MSEEAFAWFKDIVGLSGKNGSLYPLLWAYRDTAEQARKQGWLWPSYETVRRRFLALPAAERRTLMQGEKAAAASLTQYQPRRTETLLAMEQVELDGREFKVTVRFRDGSIGCPWVILIVDRASSKVVGYAVSNSENADAVAEAITSVCEEYGIPVLLLTDNGRAINSRKITGGLRPRYQTVQQRAADWDVPGVMAIYGIELQNTAPGAPRGKLPESIYSALRHIDNAPEFHRAQRSGPTDTPNPNPDVIGEDVFRAVLDKRIRDFNAMPSRAQQAQGGSRDAAFERLSQGRIVRHVSPLQRRSVKMTWHKRMVMPDGRVKFAGGLFGDATTQEAMLAHEGKYVLVGIDPTDYSAPAMVRGWEESHLRGRVLVEKLPAYEACSVNSDEGRRRAVAEKRRALALTKQYAVVNPAEKVAALQAAALINTVPPKEPAAPKVVQLDTRGPFSAAAPLHPAHSRSGDAVAVSDADNAARAELLKSLLGIKGVSREASGGNR
jgi:transposase InsO family protein